MVRGELLGDWDASPQVELIPRFPWFVAAAVFLFGLSVDVVKFQLARHLHAKSPPPFEIVAITVAGVIFYLTRSKPHFGQASGGLTALSGSLAQTMGTDPQTVFVMDPLGKMSPTGALIPGKGIAISRALVADGNPDTLRFIIAHELAHCKARANWNRLSYKLISALIVLDLWIMLVAIGFVPVPIKYLLVLNAYLTSAGLLFVKPNPIQKKKLELWCDSEALKGTKNILGAEEALRLVYLGRNPKAVRQADYPSLQERLDNLRSTSLA